MNGLHLIRQLNDKAVEQEIEKRKLDDVATFHDVDPAPSGVSRSQRVLLPGDRTVPLVSDSFCADSFSFSVISVVDFALA